MSGMHNGSYGTIVHELDPATGLQRKHRAEPPADLTPKGIEDFWHQMRWHMQEHYSWEIEFQGGKWGDDDRFTYWIDDMDRIMDQYRWWEPLRD